MLVPIMYQAGLYLGFCSRGEGGGECVYCELRGGKDVCVSKCRPRGVWGHAPPRNISWLKAQNSLLVHSRATFISFCPGEESLF